MSDLLTVGELIERIRVQNGAVVESIDMDWLLSTRKFLRRAVFVSDIPDIMDQLLEAKLVTNTDVKPVEQPTIGVTLNDIVQIKPTEEGWKQIVRHVDQFNENIKSFPQVRFRMSVPCPDAEGYISGQFWSLMQLFDWTKCLAGGWVFFHDMRIPPKPVEPPSVDGESQENVVKETRCRADVIADYVGTTIDDILNESPFWKMAGGDTEPMWFEIRDAFMAKLFDVEHEMGRQALYSEQVIENCL